MRCKPPKSRNSEGKGALGAFAGVTGASESSRKRKDSDSSASAGDIYHAFDANKADVDSFLDNVRE